MSRYLVVMPDDSSQPIPDAVNHASKSLRITRAHDLDVTIRNYWPKEAALNGTYKNPPIKKVQ
jgi:hypothetical protein